MNFDIPEIYVHEPWPPEEYNTILSEVGRIIFNWNNIERLMRQILFNLSDGREKTNILTAHMGTTIQMHALRTIANTYFQDPQKDTLLHAIKLFERLREYRNYLIHSFNMIKINQEYGAVFASMQSYMAKGNFQIKELDLDEKEIAQISKLIRCASHYFTLLHNHIVPFNHGEVPKERLKPIPEKFPLPDKLPTTLRCPSI